MNRLSKISGWADTGDYYFPKSAQGYLNPNPVNLANSGCGSGCGSKDGDERPKPSACGTGDDDKKPQPSACGAADEESKPKPGACGSSFGSDTAGA
jgi:hypothetical protein